MIALRGHTGFFALTGQCLRIRQWSGQLVGRLLLCSIFALAGPWRGRSDEIVGRDPQWLGEFRSIFALSGHRRGR